MPRQTRIELGGGMHHVTAKSPSRRVLFRNASDCERYLELVAREVQERKWRVLTFCLMTNHLHVLLQTPEPDLGIGFKRIHETYATECNQRYDEFGHVFGSRFYSGLVKDDRHVVACLRYIARNPVKAAMCAHPRDWRWSGDGALGGWSPPPAFLDVDAAYQYLGDDTESARRAYIEFVGLSNRDLLGRLEREHPDRWILYAVEHHGIPVRELAEFLGITMSAVYRRMRRARAPVGTDP
jgi:putative transposase